VAGRSVPRCARTRGAHAGHVTGQLPAVLLVVQDVSDLHELLTTRYREMPPEGGENSGPETIVCAICHDGGTPSKRGARDHVQMIATIHGAPRRSEMPMEFNIDLPCLRRIGHAAIPPPSHRIFTTRDSRGSRRQVRVVFGA
jgi:hypothetical protein